MGLYISDNIGPQFEGTAGKTNIESWFENKEAKQKLQNVNKSNLLKSTKDLEYSVLQLCAIQKKYEEIKEKGISFLNRFETSLEEKGNVHHMVSDAFFHLASYKKSIKHGKAAVMCYSKSDNVKSLSKAQATLLAAYNEELGLLNEKIEESNTYLNRFMNIFIHDIKAPIRHIQGFSRLLGKKIGGDNRYSEYVDMISSSSSLLSEMVDSLNYYVKTGSDSDEMNYVQVCPIIDNIEIVQNTSNKKVNINLDINHQVYSNENLIFQLFQNLIQNAIRHEKDDVPLNINISSRVENECIVLVFEDNGKGIKTSDQKVIFMPFAQSKRSKSEEKGTNAGMGLATCLKIMKKHKGKILLQPEKTEGTIFKMYFPIP